uniref:Protein kinase domain-containing protein n=1 Tax=Caenorhabditis japonica TaxID=281687 RepID=A0A8R1HV39_CAEJA
MPDCDSAVDETLEIGTVVGKRYKVLQKLGEGGCGSVFKVEDTEKEGMQYALKVEFASANAGNVLKMEVQILTQMSSKRHVAKCIASGKKEKFSYMVMTLLGESLESLVRKHGPFVNVSTQMRVGISVLFGIKQIHDVSENAENCHWGLRRE